MENNPIVRQVECEICGRLCSTRISDRTFVDQTIIIEDEFLDVCRNCESSLKRVNNRRPTLKVVSWFSTIKTKRPFGCARPA